MTLATRGRLEALEELAELKRQEAEQAAATASRYLHDAAAWARDCVEWPKGKSLAPYQAETMRELAEKKRVAKRGPHGLGKSTEMALLVLWFALTRDAAGIDWKVITTASVWRQLSVFLWPEIHKWAKRIRWDVVGREPFNLRTELLALQLKLNHGAATAVASNQAERIEGAHADHILYVLDEAKIIPNETWDAIEGALSNAGADTGYEAYVVAMSTPGAPNGRFYDIHMRKVGYEDWHTRHVKLSEAIAAGRISKEWAEQRARQWGKDSAMYQGRVEGNFYSDDANSVIPLAWIEAAIERWHVWVAEGRPTPKGPQWNGADVGRGGDESVIARRHGNVLIEFKTSRLRDTMRLVDTLAKMAGRAIVDVIGVGAGVYDRLVQLKKKPVAYAGSGKSNLRDKSKEFTFTNTRSAAYWRMRELLDPDDDSDICLPPDDLMTSDLNLPTWETVNGPKIKLETKEDVVERLGRSPDRGDATCMSFYADALRGPTQIAVPQGIIPRTGLSPLG